MSGSWCINAGCFGVGVRLLSSELGVRVCVLTSYSLLRRRFVGEMARMGFAGFEWAVVILGVIRGWRELEFAFGEGWGVDSELFT